MCIRDRNWVSLNFGWLYVLFVAFLCFFLLWLSLSKYGNIKLGDENSKPEYSNFSWYSMLFCGGTGIGLVFWSIAEPVSYTHLDVYKRQVYDIIAVNLAYLMALWFRFDCRFSLIPEVYLKAWIQFAPFYTVLCLAVFTVLKLYRSLWRFAGYSLSLIHI